MLKYIISDLRLILVLIFKLKSFHKLYLIYKV